MLSNTEFVRQSLELHLFFERNMMEHSFFLQVGFTQKDSNYIQQADNFRMQFDRLLRDAISLSNGVVSPSVLLSGEVITPFTLKAEMASAYLTGVIIPTDLSKSEAGLMGNDTIMAGNPMLERRVFMLNQRAMELIKSLVQFKTMILSNVLTCRIFTSNYPLLLDHIIREAKFYFQLIQRLQNREETMLERVDRL